MRHGLVLLIIGLLFPLGCAEGQKPSPRLRSEPNASRPAEPGADVEKAKPPPANEDKPKP